MLEEFVKTVVGKMIAQDYPHLKLPAVLRAVIVTAQELDDTFEYNGLTVTDTDTGTAFNARVTGKWHEYTVKILDKSGEVSDEYPEIPGVRSKVQTSVGAIVAVALADGELNPSIIGEVVL